MLDLYFPVDVYNYLLDILKAILLFGIIPNYLASIKVDVDSSVSNADKNFVQSHE